MISVWYEDKAGISTFGPRDFIAEIEGYGVATKRIDRPSETDVQLIFGSLDAPAITALSEAARARTVIVAEGGSRDDAQAEAKRQSLKFAGLVESGAWFKWRGGILVASGLFGRPEVATAAQLVSKPLGLQASDDTLPLPELVARYLLALERVGATAKS